MISCFATVTDFEVDIERSLSHNLDVSNKKINTIPKIRVWRI